jgi:hypothetical protein
LSDINRAVSSVLPHGHLAGLELFELELEAGLLREVFAGEFDRRWNIDRPTVVAP